MADWPDVGAVDAAVIALLRASAPLLAACPGGVFYGVAPSTATKVVIIERLTAINDVRVFGPGPAEEVITYMVKAVLPDSATSAARTAAATIRDVLDGCTTLAAEGYRQTQDIAEVETFRDTEVDDSNPDRWVQHWGGHYEVIVQRVASGAVQT